MSSTEDKGKQGITISKPLDWSNPVGWSLTEQAKSLRFVRDEEGNLWAYPVVIAGVTGTSIVPLAIQATFPDAARTIATQGAIWAVADQALYNPVSGNTELARTPTIWKSQISNGAGPITVWDPAAGKKYRLMGFSFVISKEAACAGAQSFSLADSGGTVIYTFPLAAAALVATGQVQLHTVYFPGNGFLSPTVDNTLVCTLGGAWTAGTVGYNAWGTEE